MSTPAKMIAFAAAVIGVLLLAMAAGKAFGPEKPEKQASSAYELVLPDDGFTAGTHELAFRIEQAGKPVTSYDTVHEKKLHLILVREDFAGFQHLHPTLTSDGTWSTNARFAPGQWHVYADFTPSGGEPQVLTGPIGIDGPAETFTPAGRTDEPTETSVDGYHVKLGGSLADGKLTPTITRDGKAVTPQPYLGAQGHLVVIRHESFDYLHVHPSGATYEVTADQPGTYELFLQFKHAGVVHTAQFTLKTAAEPDAEPTGMGHDHEH